MARPPYSSLWPLLPAELLLNAFDRLGYYDLLSVMMTNSTMSALVRPLFQRYGKLGAINVTCPLLSGNYSRREQEGVCSSLRLLALSPHSREDCDGYCRCTADRMGIPDAVEVVCINFPPKARPTRGRGLADFIHGGGTAVRNRTQLSMCTSACTGYNRPRAHCLGVDQLHKIANAVPYISTLLLRGVVVSPRPFTAKDPYRQVVKSFPAVKNCIQVLTSGYPWMPNIKTTAGWHCYSDTPHFQFPKSTENLTLIFWPGLEAMGGAWFPSCSEWYGDDKVCSPHHLDMHNCWLQSSLWTTLASQLASSRIKCLTIVNAASVPPPHRSMSQHIGMLEAGGTTSSVVHDFFLSAYEAELREWRAPKPSNVLPSDEIRFLSLEEWLEEADWQDVFSPAEISGYFSALSAGKPMPSAWARYVRFAEALGLQSRQI